MFGNLAGSFGFERMILSWLEPPIMDTLLSINMELDRGSL